MLEDTKQDMSKRFSLDRLKKKNTLCQFQRKYLNDLANIANIANIPKVKEIYVRINDYCGQRRSMNPIKYRDTSTLTENGFVRTRKWSVSRDIQKQLERLPEINGTIEMIVLGYCNKNGIKTVYIDHKRIDKRNTPIVNG